MTNETTRRESKSAHPAKVTVGWPMLTYLKPGDRYEKNDILEPGLITQTPMRPWVVGVSAGAITPRSLVCEPDMDMQPRRWSPDPEVQDGNA